ncbi:MAG: hypothetical protein ACTSRC_22530 [Candidatus Helarchaeota archaeon]
MTNIKSIVLDTTYVLPLFGIEIVQAQGFQDFIVKLWKKGIAGYKVYLPSTCLTETVFKLPSEYKTKGDISILQRYQLILPTVLNSPIEIFIRGIRTFWIVGSQQQQLFLRGLF